MKTVKDTIYLTVARNGVQSMKKSFTGSKKGEIVVKLDVEVDEKAFTPPTVSKRVIINDWQEGIELKDVEFEQEYITEEEAETIRQTRLEKMKEVLENNGYIVSSEEDENHE